MNGPVIVLRVPFNRAREVDGTLLNKGDNYHDVSVFIDPDLPVLGERQSVDGYVRSERIVLREWNEQVLLHELIHVALLNVHDRISCEGDPHGHDIVSRVEVALWETGWRPTGCVFPPDRSES